MDRRIVHVALLLVGFTPAVWGITIFTYDQQRAAVLIALGALGLALNGTALARPHFGLTVPLRVIAVGMSLIVLAGVLGMWQWIHSELLPGIPSAEVVRREILQTVAENLLWIAAAVAYVLVSILVLPVPRRETTVRAGKPQRIDFRTYGR